MSMDPSRWISTLPANNIEVDQEKYKLDSNRWVDTLPKINPKINKSNSIKKYSVTMILFAVGLMFVSAIKNETRNLQKEINNLQASVNNIRLDLHQTSLDHAVITSPENISRLAEKYLESDLVFYRPSQTKQLNKKTKTLNNLTDKKNEKTFNKKNKKLEEKIKLKVARKIEKTKTDLKKLQELYSKPEKLPTQIKVQIAQKIEKKKIDLKTLVSHPEDLITIDKIQKWGVIQVVKLFLGIPVVPGK